jgi:putative membrane protein insertion efficiency factor
MRKGRRGVVLTASAVCAIAAIVVLSADGQAFALSAIHGYQRVVSPIAARAGLRCRFTPTCSRYAETAIARDGMIRGSVKAIARIARCGPWTPPGTRDDP